VQTTIEDQRTPFPEPLPRGERIAQALLLAVLFAVPALLCLHAATVNDADIWWHLRAGEWILAHHAVPRVDSFSTFGAGKPWVDYSWLYELLVTKLFQGRGLLGLVAYSTGMVLAITVALHHLIKRLQGDFNLAVALTFVASLALQALYSPRPWHFTILLFVLVVDIVMQARRTGRGRELLWLPAIFGLWANVHIQYVDGLLVLGLAVMEAAAARWWSPARTRLRFGWIAAATAASVAATLVNPYGWHIYRTAWELASQPGVLDHIAELQSIPFRFLSDYCVLFLALGAAAVLAWRREVKVFETAFLILAAYLSFRSRRDVWLVVVAAAAILAEGLGSPVEPVAARVVTRVKERWFAGAIAVAATWAIMFCGFRMMAIGNPQLSASLAGQMPVRAVEFVKAQGYAGALYNDYAWGGYLMWGLRKPVSIDGRAGVQGTERLDRFGATWGAEPSWHDDPDLEHAGVVIGPVKAPLTQVLRMDPRFELKFEDKVAAVFVSRPVGLEASLR
jgi:GNAT superfamily N-acetyltransferase